MNCAEGATEPYLFICYLFNKILIVVVLYGLFLVLIIGAGEMILILLIIELLSWGFTLLLKEGQPFKYLLVQRAFFLGRLACLLWNPVLLIVFFFLKLGLPPFHLWFIALRFQLKKYEFLFFITIHKFLPLILIRQLLHNYLFTPVVLVMILSGRMILELRELFSVLMISSMIHRGWMIIGALVGIKLILIYFALYSILLRSLFISLPAALKHGSVEQNSNTSLIWLVLSGLPPFTLFWLKVMVLSPILVTSLTMSLLIIRVSIISLYAYYRIFHLTLRVNYQNKAFSFIPALPLSLNCF